MVINITFTVIFLPSLAAMWVGVLVSLSWNGRLSRRSAWVSLLICLALSLLLAALLTLYIFSLGLGWEVTIYQYK